MKNTLNEQIVPFVDCSALKQEVCAVRDQAKTKLSVGSQPLPELKRKTNLSHLILFIQSVKKIITLPCMADGHTLTIKFLLILPFEIFHRIIFILDPQVYFCSP